ncbi:MAG TPA: hypothetical protein VF276_00505 [Chloroflexia bacterium]
MRTEDVLAACLDAQAQGRSPAAILDHDATPEQRAELESLLDLAGRLGRLAPPGLPATRREAMGRRLAAALGAPAGQPDPYDLGRTPEVHSLAPVLELSREDLWRYIGPDGEAKIGRFLDVPGYTTMFLALRLFFRGVKRVENLGLTF